MKKIVEINNNGELRLVSSKGGLNVSHINLTVDEGKADIVTKGSLVGRLGGSDVYYLKQSRGDYKISNDYDENTQDFKDVVTEDGLYIVFDATKQVIDVTYDDACKAHFHPLAYEGTYYYDLHASQPKLLNSLPDGYQIDGSRKNEDGLSCIYNPDVMITCSVCGRATVSEDTCEHTNEAKKLWDSSGEGLRSYSYTPDFKFRTVGGADDSKGTFGIELEMVAPNKKVHPRMSPAFDADEFLYLMHDGSLPSLGCEMACHPFTYEWYSRQDDPFRLKYLSHIGMKSKDREETGLHIHISKTTFKDDDHFDAWYRLMTCNIKYLETISGRSMGSYNKACHYPNSTKKKLGDDTNRTDAISNRGATIEFRMMKGDIDRVEFGVEMLQATIEYSKSVKRNVGWTRFKKWLSTRQESYPNIIGTFIDKRVPLGVFSVPQTDQDWLADFQES